MDPFIAQSSHAQLISLALWCTVSLLGLGCTKLLQLTVLAGSVPLWPQLLWAVMYSGVHKDSSYAEHEHCKEDEECSSRKQIDGRDDCIKDIAPKGSQHPDAHHSTLQVHRSLHNG